MNIIIVFFIILFIVSIGYSFISYFNLLSGFGRLSKLSYSFGLGVAFVSFQLYIYSRLSVPWTKFDLLIPWLIFILLAIIKNRKYLTFNIPKMPKLKPIDIILMLLIIFCICYTVFEALIRPPVAWDSWATWLFQSKLFFLDGKINPEIFLRFHFNFPFAYSLLGTYIYILLGKVDDISILLVSSIFYLYLILLFFSFTKQRYGLRRALLFTLLLAATQNIIRHGGRLESGLADLPVGYYALCCITIFFEYIKNNSVKIFFIFNILLGFMAVIKLEAMFLSALFIICVIYHIYVNKLFKHLIIISFWVLPSVDWYFYRITNGIHFEYSFETSLPKIVNSFIGTFRELINVKSWNLLWITFFYSVITVKFYKYKEIIIINFIVITQILIYILIYIIFAGGYNPESSIERLLIHIAPLAMLEIVILTSLTEFQDVVKLFNFENRKVMKFVNYFIFWLNRN